MKTRILSVEDQAAEAKLDRLYMDMHADHILKAGVRYFKHFTDDIFDAFENGEDIDGAVQNAKKAGVPDGLIKTAIDYAKAGFETIPGFDYIERIFPDVRTDDFHCLIYAPDVFFEAALTGGTYRNRDQKLPHDIRAPKIWHKIIHYIWQGARLQLVTKPYLLEQRTVCPLILSDFISEDGDIYFDMLEARIQNIQADEIILKGLDEVLSVLKRKMYAEEAFSTLLSLLLLTQGYAAQNECGNLSAFELKSKIDFIFKGLGKPLITDKIKLSFEALDLKIRNEVSAGVHVSVCEDDMQSLLHSEKISDQIDKIVKLQSVLCGSVPATFTLDPDASIDDLKHLVIHAWDSGVQSIDIYRLRSGWDEPLLTSDTLKTQNSKKPILEKSGT